MNLAKKYLSYSSSEFEVWLCWKSDKKFKKTQTMDTLSPKFCFLTSDLTAQSSGLFNQLSGLLQYLLLKTALYSSEIPE